MAPIIYEPAREHSCPTPLRVVPRGRPEPGYPEGTIWQCEGCGDYWQVVPWYRNEDDRRAGLTATHTEWKRARDLEELAHELDAEPDAAPRPDPDEIATARRTIDNLCRWLAGEAVHNPAQKHQLTLASMMAARYAYDVLDTDAEAQP